MAPKKPFTRKDEEILRELLKRKGGEDSTDSSDESQPVRKKHVIEFMLAAASEEEDTATNKYYNDAESKYYNSLDEPSRTHIDTIEEAMAALRDEKPLRFQVLLSAMDDSVKAIAIQQINIMAESGEGERGKILNETNEPADRHLPPAAGHPRQPK